MSHYTLTSIDTTGIQNYIFGSNALRENIGASQLVEHAIGAWLEKSLPEPYTADGTQRLEESPMLRAEVIMSGGGNALILFREHNDAVETIKRLSRRLLCEAPGLEIAVAHQTFDWNQEALGGAEGVINQLAAAVNRRKQQRGPSAPIYNPAVLVECRATRQASSYLDDNHKPISSEVKAKLDPQLQKEAEDRFERIFQSVVSADYTFVRDVERISISEDHRHLAVVHADGNGMGQRFMRLLKDHATAAENRKCLGAMRGLSQAIAAAGETALGATLARLERSFRHEEMARYVSGLERDRDGKTIMPFRPLVFGGDDITFVCDGVLGLGLAAIFLAEFERAAAQLPYGEPGKPASACAGVVIFKSHYPFSRAYDLCEELCKETKAALRLKEIHGSGIDWHIAMSGINGSLSAIRQREYQLAAGDDLCIRPLTLRPQTQSVAYQWRTWETFTQLAQHFHTGQRDDEVEDSKTLPRSKVKALREVLREGPQAAQSFITTAKIALPELPNADAAKSGWVGQRCVYFDVIEALDFYKPIDRMEVE